MKIHITKNWDSYLFSFPHELYDIYFEEKYIKLYETQDNEAICYVYSEDEKTLLFPFLIRTFSYKGKIYHDFETAYGYGGPIWNVLDEEFILRALNGFKIYCTENNYISGFVRFHPLLNNFIGFNSIGKLIYDRHTIAMDLTLSEEDIWRKEIHTQNRNTIKKGVKTGLKFIVDKEFEFLNEFVEIYTSTMYKVDADPYFYFNNNYFNFFKANIENSFLGLVTFDDKIISGAIFFFSKQYGHYHLSGSRSDYLYTCPNNFLLYEAVKELKALGISKFHLGGGINSDEQNSLYQFKRKFSNNKYDFYIGKAVFYQEVYENICKTWVQENPEKDVLLNQHLLKYKY